MILKDAKRLFGIQNDAVEQSMKFCLVKGGICKIRTGWLRMADEKMRMENVDDKIKKKETKKEK